MKIFSSLFLSLSAVCMLTACSSKPKTETAGGGLHVVMKTDEPRLAPERMPMSDVTHRIRFGGREYEARVFRTADETLPVVKNQEGQEFIDNCVRLRVCHPVGRRAWRSFQAFCSWFGSVSFLIQ